MSEKKKHIHTDYSMLILILFIVKKQIFLVTDLLFAHVKREYHLIHGSKMEVDGIPARLILQ